MKKQVTFDAYMLGGHNESTNTVYLKITSRNDCTFLNDFALVDGAVTGGPAAQVTLGFIANLMFGRPDMQSETVRNAFADFAPEAQKLVLDKAVEMTLITPNERQAIEKQNEKTLPPAQLAEWVLWATSSDETARPPTPITNHEASLVPESKVVKTTATPLPPSERKWPQGRPWTIADVPVALDLT